MLRTVSLLLPALVPSWRFFDVIAPSPRIEVRRPQSAEDDGAGWQEFRPRPAQLTPLQMIARLFWNPGWNETLFLVSCAERLIDEPTDHSRDEIFRRVSAGLDADAFMQFRLVFLSRRGETIETDVCFVSDTRRVGDIPPP